MVKFRFTNNLIAFFHFYLIIGGTFILWFTPKQIYFGN